MNILMTIMTMLVMSVSTSEMETLAIAYPMIDNAECIYYTDTVVVALKTEPIFFRSDRIKLVNELTEDIRSKYNVREILISFDKDVYYKITKIDAKRQKGVSEDELRPDIISLIDTVRYRER